MPFFIPKELNWDLLSFEEKLMFHTLSGTIESYLNSMTVSSLKKNEAYHLFSFYDFFPLAFKEELLKYFSKEYALFAKAIKRVTLDKSELQDILNQKTHQLTLIGIFNKNRNLPGKLFIKKANGSFVHKINGDVWAINVLATSGRGLFFNHSNGMTPAGVYTVDSVMPVADKNEEFGQSRRLILNFLNSSPNEENIKQFLPRKQHEHAWWLPSIIARDMGRSLFRIHGTGKKNKNFFSPYFPMIPSSGCLTTTEYNWWEIFKKNEQRDLLDTLMEALDLPKTHENESKIQGLLYVVDFDGTYQDLEFKS